MIRPVHNQALIFGTTNLKPPCPRGCALANSTDLSPLWTIKSNSPDETSPLDGDRGRNPRAPQNHGDCAKYKLKFICVCGYISLDQADKLTGDPNAPCRHWTAGHTKYRIRRENRYLITCPAPPHLHSGMRSTATMTRRQPETAEQKSSSGPFDHPRAQTCPNSNFGREPKERRRREKNIPCSRATNANPS